MNGSTSSPARLGRLRAARPLPRLLVCVITVVACLAPVAPVRSQTPPSSLTPNAALYYWRAWFDRDTDFLKSLTETHGYKSSDPAWKPGEELTRQLAQHEGYIAGVVRASKVGPCDFGIAYEDGYMALIPHVGLMRESARLLGCDARRAWAAGQSDEAGQRLAAIVRMARHTNNDRVAISSLVGTALLSTALDEVRAMEQAGKLTPAVRTMLAELVRPLDTDDPFGIRNAIESERAMAVTYVRKRVEADGTKVLDEMISLTESADADTKSKVKSLTKDDVIRDLEKVDRYFREAAAVWDAADRDARLTAMAEDAQSGKYGVVGKILLPAMAKLSENARKGRTVAQDLLKVLGSR